MKLLITGICGFVGSRLALALKERLEGVQIAGIDNLYRPGSESNRSVLGQKGVSFFHGDLRMSKPCPMPIGSSTPPKTRAFSRASTAVPAPGKSPSITSAER